MNKQQLSKQIANRMSVTVQLSQTFLKTFEEVVSESIEEEDKIILQGFGTFRLWHQAERPGRNPKTGDRKIVHARTSVKFKPGKILLEKLNRKAKR